MNKLLERFRALRPETPEDIIPHLRVEAFSVLNPRADRPQDAIDNTFRVRRRMIGPARKIGILGLHGAVESVRRGDLVESEVHFEDEGLKGMDTHVRFEILLENPDDFPDIDFVRIVAQGVHLYLYGLDQDKEPSEAASY